MEHDPKQDHDMASLEDLFAEARMEAPLPSADLLSRIEADAVRLQPPLAAQTISRERPLGWAAQISGWLGRVALPSGLVAAGLTGVWLGLSFGTSESAAVYSFYESGLGMQIIYDFPALAGLMPEG